MYARYRAGPWRATGKAVIVPEFIELSGKAEHLESAGESEHGSWMLGSSEGKDVEKRGKGGPGPAVRNE